jgi:hypothetical protein
MGQGSRKAEPVEERPMFFRPTNMSGQHFANCSGTSWSPEQARAGAATGAAEVETRIKPRKVCGPANRIFQSDESTVGMAQQSELLSAKIVG